MTGFRRFLSACVVGVTRISWRANYLGHFHQFAESTVFPWPSFRNGGVPSEAPPKCPSNNQALRSREKLRKNSRNDDISVAVLVGMLSAVEKLEVRAGRNFRLPGCALGKQSIRRLNGVEGSMQFATVGNSHAPRSAGGATASEIGQTSYNRSRSGLRVESITSSGTFLVASTRSSVSRRRGRRSTVLFLNTADTTWRRLASRSWSVPRDPVCGAGGPTAGAGACAHARPHVFL